MTNIYTIRDEQRKLAIRELFESHYRTKIDDFFDARDQLLRDIEEVFREQWDVAFRTIVLNTDNYSRATAKKLFEDLARAL